MSTGGGAKTGLFGNAGTAGNMSSNLYGNANSLYGFLSPELQTEAVAPGGYAPSDLAAMNTAAQQSAGGSMSGAVGQGALLASRTKNAGTPAAAIARSAEAAGGNLSRAAVGTQAENADLKQRQQQAGLSGLEGLYGTNLSGSLNALGLGNSAYGTAGQLDVDNPWFKVLQSGLQAAGTVGAAGLQAAGTAGAGA